MPSSSSPRAEVPSTCETLDARRGMPLGSPTRIEENLARDSVYNVVLETQDVLLVYLGIEFENLGLDSIEHLQPKFVLSDVRTGEDEFEIDLVPGLLIKYPNAFYTHRVEAHEWPAGVPRRARAKGPDLNTLYAGRRYVS